MSQGNEIKLPDGITYSLMMLEERAQTLHAELQAAGGAVATILAPYVPAGDQPADWKIEHRPDRSTYLVKKPQPPSVPAPAPLAPDLSEAPPNDVKPEV